MITYTQVIPLNTAKRPKIHPELILCDTQLLNIQCRHQKTNLTFNYIFTKSNPIPKFSLNKDLKQHTSATHGYRGTRAHSTLALRRFAAQNTAATPPKKQKEKTKQYFYMETHLFPYKTPHCKSANNFVE